MPDGVSSFARMKMDIATKRGEGMYEIRKITPSEVDNAIKLSEYSFKYKLEGEVRVKRAKFMENHVVLGAFWDGEMVAKTHIIPLSVAIDHEDYSMGGVASISTYPEHRRQGLVNRLLGMALQQMRQEGQVLSYLHPFDISFYRRYGYELISNLKKTTVMARDLYSYPRVSGRVSRHEAGESIDQADEVYAAWSGQYNGMLRRNEKWWREAVYGEDILALYRSAQGIPRGYLFYSIKDETLEVTEYAYLDEESRRGLWNFIANHDSMVEKVEITSPDLEQMSFLWRNPVVKTEIIPDFMGRVVLVKEFLELYFRHASADLSLTLYVQDELAGWNTGLYRIGAGRVEFDPGARAEGLSMDIGTFTALFLGSQRAEFLYEAGRITGDRGQLSGLSAALSPQHCAFMDYF
ncbi:MAG: N-acetyltransferase Eis [Firmicutes bacterium]|nr:N-acetyltransferase Eis [Bacillota bacterium]MBT9157270.1 N-acetyltransferase Eis [Bacillota bacterium]